MANHQLCTLIIHCCCPRGRSKATPFTLWSLVSRLADSKAMLCKFSLIISGNMTMEYMHRPDEPPTSRERDGFFGHHDCRAIFVVIILHILARVVHPARLFPGPKPTPLRLETMFAIALPLRRKFSATSSDVHANLAHNLDASQGLSRAMTRHMMSPIGTSPMMQNLHPQ